MKFIEKKNQTGSNIVYMGLFLCGVACFTLALTRPGFAEEGVISKTDEKSMKGTVASIGRGTISIEYDSNETESFEALLRLSDHLAFQGYKSLADVKLGDRVEVIYAQTYHDDEKGEKFIEDSRVEKIVLIRGSSANQMISREQN